MTIEHDIKGPAVKFSPPLIFLILLLAGYGVRYFQPVSLGIPSGFEYIGIPVGLFGIFMLVTFFRAFKRAKTNVDPWEPTTAIVSTGIYGFSRNPAYLGFCVVQIGFGLFSDSLWVLLSFIPSAILVFYVAINKEEKYLESKFGDEYLRYKSHVRRWI